MEVTEENKVIARKLRDATDGRPKIIRHSINDPPLFIDIYFCPDQPFINTTTYGTVGLSGHDSSLQTEGMPLRVELISACLSKYIFFEHLMAECCFYIIQGYFVLLPGLIIPNIFETYLPNSEIKHLIIIQRCLYEESLQPIRINDKIIAWLMALPISEQERIYFMNNTVDQLEDLLASNKIDFYDLERKSVL